MGRAVTKNTQGELEVTETFNFAGANPTIGSVKLIAKDGSPVEKENPSWLGFSQSVSGQDLDVVLQLDASEVDTYTTYTFKISATDDQGNEKSRRVNVGIGSLATAFGIKNVMGQEDKYRQTGGTRVDNGGSARVVLTTTMPATVDVEYVRNPSDEDNPTFQQSLSSVTSQDRYHEFFFPVDPDSLYAFQITAKADFDQSVPDQVSSIYYLFTGSELSYQSDDNLDMSTGSQVQIQSSVIGLTGALDFGVLSSNPAGTNTKQQVQSTGFSAESPTVTSSATFDVEMQEGDFGNNLTNLVSSQVV